MKKITLTCYDTGIARVVSTDTNLNNESGATLLEIDFSNTENKLLAKFVDIVLSDGTSLRYSLGIDEVVSMELTSANTIAGEVILTPLIFVDPLKIKYKPNKTIVIYEQLEAGTADVIERDDFIFELKTKVDNIVPLNGGWIDLLGYPTIKGIGVNDPAYVNYIGNIMQYQFASNEMNELSFEYHLPHGYVLGSDMFIHTHWSTKIVDLGNAKWYFEISFAKGYDRGAFSEPIIVSVIQGGSTVARSHQIAEVQFTDDGTLKIDRTLIEPDGLILVRMYRDPADIDDTLTEAPFVHFVNVHMQIDKIATPNRNYPFE